MWEVGGRRPGAEMAEPEVVPPLSEGFLFLEFFGIFFFKIFDGRSPKSYGGRKTSGKKQAKSPKSRKLRFRTPTPKKRGQRSKE